MHSLPVDRRPILALTLLISCWPLASLCAASPAATPTAPTAVAPATAPADSATVFASFDRIYDALRAVVSNAASNSQPEARDTRGRTISDDIHEWILSPDSQSHIDALRREADLALHAGRGAAEQEDLKQAAQLLAQEIMRLQAIRFYWRENQILDVHRALWQTLLDEVTPAQAADSHAKIDPLEQQLVKLLGPELTSTSIAPAMQSLIAAYNQERGKLAQDISDERIVAGAVDPVQPRRTPCPVPSRKTSGGVKPSMVPGSVNVGDYYPVTAQSEAIEGRVVLKLRIDAGGCMQGSSLQVSSGSPALDDAAAALVERARFLPAQRGGKAVAMTYLMAVKFAPPPPQVAASSQTAVAPQAGESSPAVKPDSAKQ